MPVIRAGALPYAALPGRHAANPLPEDFAGGCSVRIVRIEPGTRTPHRHPRSAEVVYVAAGRGTAWEDGTATEVSAGDVLFIAAGVPHATIARDGELMLVCFFPDGDLSSNIEELGAPELS